MEELRERLEIGRVIQFSVETIGAKVVPFALLVLAVGGFDTLLNMSGSSGASRLSSFTSLILYVAATYFALKVRFGDDVVIKMAFGRALGVYVLSGLGVLLGLILLIIPGLYLWVIWTLAVPALMTEDLSISQALSRSKSLSEGNRIKLFCLIVLVPISTILFVFGSASLSAAVFGEAMQSTWGYNLVVDTLACAAAAFSSVLMAEAYVSLSGQRSRLSALRDVFA